MVAFHLAIKNVYRKRERSFLTIIGVLLAVGSFISLLSIAEGLYTRVSNEIYGRSVDIYLLPGDAAALPTGPIGTIGFSSEVLATDLVEKLEKIQDISLICPIYRIQQRMGGRRSSTIIIWGIDSDKFKSIFNYFQLQPGSRMYMDTSKEVIVGGSLAAGKGIHIGSPFVIEGQPFDTVGVGMPMGAFQDYFCFISLQNAISMKNAKGYQEIWLQIRGRTPQDRETAAAGLRKLYPNLNVKTREEYLWSANEYVYFAWLLEFAIAAIGILIAMTASMNTMLMSTYERIKEFGTLRAIGASRFTVFSMILMESLILTTVGGSGGIILGVMGSRVLDEAVRALMQLSFPLARITPSLLIYSLILSVTVGVVGAIIPAIIVYRMNTIDALRWE